MALFIVKISILVFIIHVIIKIYLKLSTGWCKSQVCLQDKTTIITGGNTGIGYETALDFAKRGARVILACRDLKKGEKARDQIIEETGNKNVLVKIIDMASFDSVRNFAKDINATEGRLDILVNNAGAFGLGDKRSVDGHELLMQINHFSNFLLTNLLIGLLKKTAPSRIVNVSSEAAKRVFDENNMNELDKFVSNFYNYRLSKLCNVLFTIELGKKLEATGVTTYSLHPGLVKTEIFRNNEGFFKMILDLVVNLYAKTSEEGAQTTIHCSVAKGIEDYNGEHFVDCQKVPAYKSATNPGFPKKVWELSEKIVDLKPEEYQF